MSLIDDLKANQEIAVDEKAIEFAEKMEARIIESSKNGYPGYKYQINSNDPDKHLMFSPLFIEKVEDLMDGVKVKFAEEKKKTAFLGTYYERYIHFSWSN